MKNRYAVLIWAAMVGLVFHVKSHADPGSVDAVFNKALLTQEVTREDARNLYLLKERSLKGTNVLVYRMPLRSKLHAEFVRDVLRMTPQQFDKEWMKLVNAGLAPQIGEAATETEMMSLLNRRVRGIGYLSHDYLVLNGGGDAVIVKIVD